MLDHGFAFPALFLMQKAASMSNDDHVPRNGTSTLPVRNGDTHCGWCARWAGKHRLSEYAINVTAYLTIDTIEPRALAECLCTTPCQVMLQAFPSTRRTYLRLHCTLLRQHEAPRKQTSSPSFGGSQPPQTPQTPARPPRQHEAHPTMTKEHRDEAGHPCRRVVVRNHAHPLAHEDPGHGQKNHRSQHCPLLASLCSPPGSPRRSERHDRGAPVE